MDLTQGQLDALRIMAGRERLEQTDFINIADAQAVTSLGLARRTRDGWALTPDGLQAIAQFQGKSATPQAAGDEHPPPERNSD